jgi:dUTPase
LANIPTTLTGNKIVFPHRHSALIDTGLEVYLEKGYKLCFSLAPALAERGMLATNAPGNFTNGRVKVGLLNAGRDIVELKDGDPVAVCWVEQIHEFDWDGEE